MVDLASKGISKPSDDRQSPQALPYDPKEWEQRVAAARAQREKVLQQRSRDARRAEGSSGAAFSVANSKNDQPHSKQPQTVRRLPAALPGKTASTAANRLTPAPLFRAGPIQADMEPRSRQTGGRFKPLLVGLLLGSVAGASLVSFVAIRLGVTDLKVPSTSLALPPPLAPSVDVPASSLQRQPPPLPENEPALVDFATPSSVATAFALPDPLETLGTRETEPLVSTEAAIVAEPNENFVPREIFGPPSLEAGFGTAGIGPDSTLIDERIKLSLQKNLGYPPATIPDAVPQQGLSAPQPQAARIALHIPEQTPSYRRDAAVSRLTETGWPTQIITTPFTIAETHVRYFHTQDRGSAEMLAEQLGSEVRDFTHFTPSPEDGYLELWLGGEGAPPQVRSAQPRVAAPAPSTSIRTNSAPAAPHEERGDNDLELLVPRAGAVNRNRDSARGVASLGETGRNSSAGMNGGTNAGSSSSGGSVGASLGDTSGGGTASGPSGSTGGNSGGGSGNTGGGAAGSSGNGSSSGDAGETGGGGNGGGGNGGGGRG